MVVNIRGRLVWTLAMVLVGLACCVAWAREDSSLRGAEWIRAEKMRAVYAYTPDTADEQLLTTLKNIGLNTLIAKYDGYDFEKVREVAAAAEGHGLHFFSTAFFRGGPEIGRALQKGSRHYVNEQGVEAPSAWCPLDVRGWEATIFDRAMPLVEYSRDHPLVAGFISDVENYGAQGPFNIMDFCYCEGCLADFFKASGMNEDTKAIPAPDRKKWLDSKGLLDGFKQWEQEEVERVCRSQRERVDAINPDFLLGALLELRDPLAWGMARGFATERAPFMIMPEDTYGGFKVTIPEFYEQAEKHGVPAVLVPGIWPRRHIPTLFSTHFYLNATMADGYWLYYERVTLKDMLVGREPAAPFAIAGTPEQWRRAISHMNQEIDRRLADPKYQPQLMPADPRLPREMTALSARTARASAGVRVTPQSWHTFFDAPWKGAQVMIEAEGPGGSVTFDLGEPVPADRYQLSLFLSKSADHGIVQTYLDGKKVGEPIDCYSPRRFATDHIPVGDIMALDGQREIGFRIVGKNPKSSGYNFGVAGYRLQTFAGFAKDWMVLGPFPNPGDKGLDIDYLNGWQPDGPLGLTYIGKGEQKIEWKRAATQPDRDGYLNLATFFTDNTKGVAYVYTWVKSPGTSLRRIWVGSDDGMMMWVNGTEVLYVHVHHGASPDYSFVDLELKEGWTPILVKVDQGIGDWGLYLRISDPRGELKYSAARD